MRVTSNGILQRTTRVLALVLCGIALAAAAQPPVAIEDETELHVDPEVQRLRNIYLNWVTSLRSFSGSFSLEEMYAVNDPPRLNEITYRYDGENRYLANDMVRQDGRRHKKVLALLDGNLDSMGVQYTEQGEEYTASVGKGPNRWSIPPSSLLTPEVMIQRLPFLQDVTGFMAVGRTLRLSGNEIGFRHYNSTQFIEVTFDDALRVVRVDYCYAGIVDARMPEELGAKVYAFKEVTGRRDFLAYQDINGYPFPTSGARITYRNDNDVLGALMDAYQMGEIDAVEYQERRARENVPYAWCTETYHMDVDTLRVNEDLPDSDFRLHIPAGAVVFNEHGVRIDNLPWWRRHPGLAVAVGIGLGVAVLAAGAILAYRKLA